MAYSTTIDAGAGLGLGLGVTVPLPPGAEARPDPRREAVSPSIGFAGSAPARTLADLGDDVERGLGGRIYDQMLSDPHVRGSFDALRAMVVGEGPVLEPTVARVPGSTDPQPDADAAEEVADFCGRCSDGMDGSPALACFALLEGMAHRSKLAEAVYRDGTGPDTGRLMLKALKIKPRGSWHHVVDPTLNVVGVLATVVDPDGRPRLAVLPRERFAIFTWMPRDGDPRGTSILRAAYSAWNLKVRVWPQYYKYLSQFASPSLAVFSGENQQAFYPAGADGFTDNSKPPQTPEQANLATVIAFQGGSAMALPHGCLMQVIQSQGNGEAFLEAVDLFDRQIVFAIMGQVRASMEAQNGSKADSETGQDLLGRVVQFVRLALAECWREDVLKPLVAVNFGDDAAARFTPRVGFGRTGQEDFSGHAAAVAALTSAGYLAEDQKPAIDAMLGLPVRDPAAADEEAAEPGDGDDGIQDGGGDEPGDEAE